MKQQGLSRRIIVANVNNNQTPEPVKADEKKGNMKVDDEVKQAGKGNIITGSSPPEHLQTEADENHLDETDKLKSDERPTRQPTEEHPPPKKKMQLTYADYQEDGVTYREIPKNIEDYEAGEAGLFVRKCESVKLGVIDVSSVIVEEEDSI